MITIDLGTIEEYDDKNNEFIYQTGGVVDFEYSLKAVFEWEAKWKTPFLKGNISEDAMIDFYKMMALQPFDEKFLRYDVMTKLRDYINDSSTATVFTSRDETKSSPNNKGKFHTAEEIYAIMVQANVPIEWEKRNLNRLLVMLRIISLNNEPPKKMNKRDVLRQNASLNEQRKAMLKTKG